MGMQVVNEPGFIPTWPWQVGVNAHQVLGQCRQQIGWVHKPNHGGLRLYTSSFRLTYRTADIVVRVQYIGLIMQIIYVVVANFPDFCMPYWSVV